MALSASSDKSKKPKPAELQSLLGRTAAHWDALKAHLAAEYAPLDETWTYAGANWGWSLRLKQKKRTILSLTPRAKHFLAGLALSEEAVQAAREAGLPEAVLTQIDQAPNYPEGRGVRLEVRNRKDREVVKKLSAIKMG